MMRKLLAGLAVASILAFAAPRVALAHHAMQAEFDQNNVVVISGVLKKVNWVNPHVNFLLDVTEPDGKVTTWTLVHAGPNQLRAAGLSDRDFFQVGKTYTASLALWSAVIGREPSVKVLKAKVPVNVHSSKLLTAMSVRRPVVGAASPRPTVS